jgi:CBS domain-containing protein
MKMAKRVHDAMTPNPRTVHMEASVLEAAQAMAEEGVGSIPVVDTDEILFGVITDRDIVLRVVAEKKDPAGTQAGAIASQQVGTAYPDQRLEEALQLMAHWRVRRLPVIEDDRVVGILAQADVAQEARAKRAGQLVEEISHSAPADAPE